MDYVDQTPGNSSLDRKPSWKAWIRENLFSRLRCNGVYGIGPFTSAFFSLILSVKPLRSALVHNHLVAEETNFDLDWMLNFESLIRYTLPTCFRDIEKIEAIRKRTSARKGRVNVIGPDVYYKETQKVRLAHRIESGEKIVSTQHGGNYGTLKSVPLISQVEYRHEAFVSWGWTEQEDYRVNVAALPSPFLSQMAHKHREDNDELILVGTLGNLLSYRLDSTPQALQQLLARRNKSDFMSGLEPRVFQKTAYRPYFFEDGALEDRSYFRRTFQSVAIVEGNLYTRIMNCKLLVLDHPITTLNVALAANIPIVGFWDRRAWAMCRQAVPYFSALEMVQSSN